MGGWADRKDRRISLMSEIATQLPGGLTEEHVDYLQFRTVNGFCPIGMRGLAPKLKMEHRSVTAMLNTYKIRYSRRAGKCDPGFREEFLYRHLRGLGGGLL
jgi:hypothetical protein